MLWYITGVLNVLLYFVRRSSVDTCIEVLIVVSNGVCASQFEYVVGNNSSMRFRSRSCG